jgi:hypothetical protein
LFQHLAAHGIAPPSAPLSFFADDAKLLVSRNIDRASLARKLQALISLGRNRDPDLVKQELGVDLSKAEEVANFPIQVGEKES